MIIKEKDIEESIYAFAVSNGDINIVRKNDKPEKYCQISNNNLMELTIPMDPDENLVRKSHSRVKIGGTWNPNNCVPLVKVLIIVPFRGRDEQLEAFLRIMHLYLQKQNVQYTILVSEQSTRSQFNRAKLFNIGFIESTGILSSEKINCVIFHDVDLIPLDVRNIYGCSIEGPRHLSSNLQQWRFLLPYQELFGGVIAVANKDFKDVNGFSNEYFGWGGEDDDFRNRIQGKQVVRFEGHIARYTMLRHKKEVPNPKRFDILNEKLTEMNSESTEMSARKNTSAVIDGLSNTQYTLVSAVKKPLYTHIISDF